MNKNILIVFLLLIIVILGYFQFRPKNIDIPSNNAITSTDQNLVSQVLTFDDCIKQSGGFVIKTNPAQCELNINGKIVKFYENNIEEKNNTEQLISDISVVNGESGVNVLNPLFSTEAVGNLSTDDFLSYMQKLPTGIYNVSVSAPGYKIASGVKFNVPGNLKGMTINLEPTTKKYDCPKHPLNSNNFAFCGYITDENHNAISGVKITSVNFNSVLTTTNSDGYFETEFPPLKNYDCNDPVTFTYTKTGYKTFNYILNGLQINIGGDMGTKLVMHKGVGSEQQIVKHGMCR